jgi:hypothetical protein
MAITVQHQPSFKSVGDVSSDYGSFIIKREDAQKAEDIKLKFALADKEAQINANAQQQQYENNAALQDQQFHQKIAAADIEFELNQQAKEAEKQREIDDKTTEYRYTQKQQMTIDNLTNQKQDILLNKDLMPEEKDYAIQELDSQLQLIKPQRMPKDPNSPPKGQEIGSIWKLEDGSTVTRHSNGDVATLIKAKDISTPGTISEKTKMNVFENIYEAAMKKNSTDELGAKIDNPAPVDMNEVIKKYTDTITAMAQADIALKQQFDVINLSTKQIEFYNLAKSKGYSHSQIMDKINQRNKQVNG